MTTTKDLSGQVKEVRVATSMNVQDRKVRTVKVDRTGAALHKVLPPTDDGNGATHRGKSALENDRRRAELRKR